MKGEGQTGRGRPCWQTPKKVPTGPVDASSVKSSNTAVDFDSNVVILPSSDDRVRMMQSSSRDVVSLCNLLDSAELVQGFEDGTDADTLCSLVKHAGTSSCPDISPRMLCPRVGIRAIRVLLEEAGPVLGGVAVYDELMQAMRHYIQPDDTWIAISALRRVVNALPAHPCESLRRLASFLHFLCLNDGMNSKVRATHNWTFLLTMRCPSGAERGPC